jgi:hypothetical protein
MKPSNTTPAELMVPLQTNHGKNLDSFYQLEFRLNYKFPFRKIFPERKDRNITQNDFDRMLAQVEAEVSRKNSGREKRRN